MLVVCDRGKDEREDEGGKGGFVNVCVVMFSVVLSFFGREIRDVVQPSFAFLGGCCRCCYFEELPRIRVLWNS